MKSTGPRLAELASEAGGNLMVCLGAPDWKSPVLPVCRSKCAKKWRAGKARTEKFLNRWGGWALWRERCADLEKSPRDVVDGFEKM